MNIHKIAGDNGKCKSKRMVSPPALLQEYDHYIALDWSSKVMDIARLTKRQQHLAERASFWRFHLPWRRPPEG